MLEAPSLAPADVTAEALTDAIAICQNCTLNPALPAAVLARVTHAQDRLEHDLATYLFGGPSKAIRDEQQALAIIKVLALELHAAASALDTLAERVKLSGRDGQLASQLKQSATKAHRAADQWVDA